jgi:hypothetical protein
MVRTITVLWVLLGVPTIASAQFAICDCCALPYRVEGAQWIGTARGYGGLCPDCLGRCPKCDDLADDLRTQYQAFRRMLNEPGLTPDRRALINFLINRMPQRWSDLRYSCLANGGPDIGPLAPGAPEPPPSRGNYGPEAKERLRKDAAAVYSRIKGYDHWRVDATRYSSDVVYRTAANQYFNRLRQDSRTYDLLNRLANDPPDPDYTQVVKPEVADVPRDRGEPDDFLAIRKAAIAQGNSNAYLDAYITSFERYQAAKKAANKEATKRQVDAMARFAFLAEKEARTAAARAQEYDRLWLKQHDAHRAAQGKKGVKWQEELKAAQAKLKDGWPQEAVKDFDAAKVPQAQRDEIRQAILAQTPEGIEKAISDRRAEVEFDDAIAAELAKVKVRRPVVWPEPTHIEALELARHHANLLHAELAGRKKELPKDNPFPATKKGDKK